MKKDYTEMNPYVLAIPVLAIGLQDSASACISPAIASIAASYPDVAVSTVQLLVTLPGIAVCIVSILYGWLSVRINPRTLVVIGLSLFVIGGMAPLFVTSFDGILACRVILGMGAGLTLPACDSIIPRLYKGRMRENMMGWNMTAGAIGVTVMIFIGGQLAAVDWHLSFLGYSVGLVSLILVLCLLPRIPMVKSEKDGNRPALSEVVTNIKWLAWVEIIVYFVGNLFATMVTSNLSLFVEGGGIGTPADSGNALSLQMAGAALGAFGYGWLKKNLGHTEAIILSMTPYERSHPDCLNASRKKRIAAGCGMKVEDVNRLLNQFRQTQKLMKQFGGMGKGKRRRMPNLPL